MSNSKYNDQKLQLKFFIFFYQKETTIYLSVGLHKVCPSYRRSIQLSKEAIQHALQNMNFQIFNFVYFCFVGHFCNAFTWIFILASSSSVVFKVFSRSPTLS